MSNDELRENVKFFSLKLSWKISSMDSYLFPICAAFGSLELKSRTISRVVKVEIMKIKNKNENNIDYYIWCFNFRFLGI